MEGVAVSKVTVTRDKAKITLRKVPDAAGVAAELFAPLADAGIVVDIVVQNLGIDGTTDISFTLAAAECKRAIEILRASVPEMCSLGRLDYDDTIARVSLVGVGMRSHASVAARAFQLLAEAEVNILLISTSELKISCVIEAKHAETARTALCTGFGLC